MTSVFTYNGGTVIGMAGKDCVTIGSDLRIGEQFLTVQTETQKVYKISDRIYVGMPGLATDAQTVVDRLKFRTDLYKLRENRPVKCTVLATMLSNLLYEHRFGPYFVEPVVAGLDPVSYKPYVCSLDLIGCISHPRDFVVTGTAGEQLFGICEAAWEENLDAEGLFEVTAQCLMSGLERDAASGWGAVIYTVTKDTVTARTVKSRMD